MTKDTALNFVTKKSEVSSGLPIWRAATQEEINADIEREIGRSRKILFSHHTLELYAPTAKIGVRHQRVSRRLPRLIDGEAVVTFRGRIEILKGQKASTDGGETYHNHIVYSIKD